MLVIIKQKRIRNLSKLNGVKEGTMIVPVVRVENLDKTAFIKAGFTEKLDLGETILPNKIGPITRYNADGGCLVHKDKPKETYYLMREWTYKKWVGGGDTEEVTDWVDVPRKRYPRTIIEPLALELAVMEDGRNEKLVCLPSVVFNESNSKLIIHEVNIMLELFGECEIVDYNLNPILKPTLKKLNWEVFPKGKMPWIKRKATLERFIVQARGKNSGVIRKRLETIYEHNPDFVAIGNGGFSGYLILGFEEKNLYILESTQVNNATYILENQWEDISKLSKAEILNNQYHKNRVIHSKQWFEDIKALLV